MVKESRCCELVFWSQNSISSQSQLKLAMVRYHLPRLLLDNDMTIPRSPVINGSTASGGGGGGAGQDSFDSNMVIILAALLCALICALGLNSIVRCVLRCSERLAIETSNEAVARLGSKGLKEETLTQIPVVVYKSKEVRIPVTDCTICLGEFKEGEKVRILPKCNHGFHVKCIDKWLASHASCPICRQLLLDPHISVSCNEAIV